MTTQCFTPIRGKRLRVTRLDECGNVPARSTPSSYVCTDGFISVSLSAEVESGTEIITRKADGSLCVNERMADSFKRFTVEIQFCNVDPDLYELVTNADPYADYSGNVNGITIAEGTIDSKFALELWTGLTGAACQPGVEEASGYLLLPFVNAGTLGDLDINGENAIQFSLTGAFTKGGNNWGVGPWKVLQAVTPTNEVQTISAPGSPTGGTFMITFNGQTTAPIAYNATATTVRTALQALSNVGANGVTVSGGPLPTNPVTVTFTGPLAGEDVPQMTLVTTGLTGAASTPAMSVATATAGNTGAGVLPTALDPLDHLLLVETGIAPPPAACGAKAMPAVLPA